jgi:hypothetical protein
VIVNPKPFDIELRLAEQQSLILKEHRTVQGSSGDDVGVRHGVYLSALPSINARVVHGQLIRCEAFGHLPVKVLDA